MLLKRLAQSYPGITQDEMDKLICGVVDFSEAQRNGFATAYANFFISRLPAREQCQGSFDHLQKRALGLLKGCAFHFEQSVERVRSNSSFAVGDKSLFSKLIRELRETIDIDAFLEVADKILKKFPKCRHWLKWWLRCDIAGAP